MEIRVQSIKFDADQKLLDFIDKKFSKLSKFCENIIRMEVVLSLEPDHVKKVKAKVAISGDDFVVERSLATFEDGVNECVDLLKDILVKTKEKRLSKSM